MKNRKLAYLDVACSCTKCIVLFNLDRHRSEHICKILNYVNLSQYYFNHGNNGGVRVVLVLPTLNVKRLKVFQCGT